VSPDGKLLWANDTFLSFAGLATATNKTGHSIFDVFSEDDQEGVRNVWTRIFTGDDHLSAELRSDTGIGMRPDEIDQVFERFR
jgi:hypothetical protein